MGSNSRKTRFSRSCQVGLLVALLSNGPATHAVSVGGLNELYSWPEDSVNLVQNPSFESTGPSGQPVGWTLYESFSVSSESVHSGRLSLLLKDSNLAKYTPATIQGLSISPGWYVMRGWMKAQNAATSNKAAGGRVTLKTQNGNFSNWESSGLVNGTTDWIRFERRDIPVGAGETGQLRLEAYQKPDGSIFFDDLEVRRLIPATVEGYLLHPNYRGLLFDDESRPIEMSVTVRPEEAKLQLSDLTVTLALESYQDGRPATTVSSVVKPTSSNFTMKLSTAALANGEYQIRLRALNAITGAIVFEYPAYKIVKLPAQARKNFRVFVDPDNTLVLAGKRSFVLGIYDTTGYWFDPAPYESRFAKIAEAGINFYLNYWLSAAPDRALNAMMAALQKYGMYYLQTVNTWYQGSVWPGANPQCGGKTFDALGQDGFTACRATTLGTHPGLGGWYTADEAPAGQAAPVFAQYKALRQGLPHGVTFIAQNNMRELSRWRDAVDVMGVDPYPIYNIPLGQLSRFETVTEWVEAAQKAVEHSRPVWGIIQYFQFGGKGHWPTYNELRTMSYMAIVAGAKGLFYWSYGAKGLAWVRDPALKEELWQRLVRVTKEIKSIEPVLLSPDDPRILSSLRLTSETGATIASGAIRYLSKRVGKDRYIICVNNTPTVIKAEFTIDRPASNVDVLGEGYSLPVVRPGVFQDQFTPYATHVYKVSR